jgi:Ca-activated chloride channel homolog
MISWKVTSFLIVAGVLVLLLSLAYALDFTRRGRLLERIDKNPMLARMAASVSGGKRGLKTFLLVGGVALVTLALARPQVPGTPTWKPRGIDVAVVLDFSKSMLARDVYPSRIERARLEVDRLLDKFGEDRVAVVAYGGGAVHYPLTADYEAAKLLYHGLDPRDLPPGSDLGEGIRTARCLLLPSLGTAGQAAQVGDPSCKDVRGSSKAHAEEGRVAVRRVDDRAQAIVVLSDGEDTEGRAEAEVQAAAKLGIPVFFVGIGTKGGARIPELDAENQVTGWKLDETGKNFVTTRLDENSLKGLAKSGGGEDHYFRADPRRPQVEGLLKELSGLKEGTLEERAERKPTEAYHFLLFPAFIILLIEACISDRKREKRVKAT